MFRTHRPLAVALIAASAVVVAAGAHRAIAQDAAAATPTAGTFKVDPPHSFAMFRITHLGAGVAFGMFDGPTGTMEQSADGLKSVEFHVEIDKVHTGNEQRDKHLKGPDFFNAKQFPEMMFKSTGVKAGGDAKTFDVTGDLTIKGVTKRTTVTLKKLGEGKGMQGELRAGYEGMFKVNRIEYGITWNPGAVGNDVDVTIAFEGVKQ